MKILVTGGCGFIGSAFIRRALGCGHVVFNIDKLTYAASDSNIPMELRGDKYFFEKIDICDLDGVRRVIFNFKPDAVIHFAAESHVDRSIVNPLEFVRTNVVGTCSLLSVALDFWKQLPRGNMFRFHHVSTDEVFGSLDLADGSMFNEGTKYDPRSPYSASKASSDHFVRAWYETYGLPVLITNCSNNYGPYHFPEKLIPQTIINALLGRSIPIYGDGLNVRDWLYVDDHADALLQVLSDASVGSEFVIGGNNEISNLDLVKRICDLIDIEVGNSVGASFNLVKFVEDRAGHDRRYAIDASRIREVLGWSPQTEINDGLLKTVRWFLKNRDWWIGKI